MNMYQIDDPRQVVKQIQTYLLANAYQNHDIPKLVINGIYDAPTREAVTTFQRSVGLPPTGVVDYRTWQRLYEEQKHLSDEGQNSTFTEVQAFPLRLGDTGHPVTVLQSQLGEFSRIYPNVMRPAITGQFGLATADAVRAMQRNYGEYANGVVTVPFWNRMQRDYRAQKEFARRRSIIV
jgi:peptidoglycan hydrolase-like protein with peptidoglycan-binding domain